ncbi:MAG: BON domain-containing protein [Gammaproteobacteria bacterium]|nr:BON domain-containing protein [Gammaproteobacteria bacterium]
MKSPCVLAFTVIIFTALVTACASNSPTIESRLSPGRLLDDRLLVTAITKEIREVLPQRRDNVQITPIVLDGRVYLIGSVREKAIRDQLTEVIGDFRHVRSVHNELHVGQLRTDQRARADRRLRTQARFALVNDPRTRNIEINLYVHKGSIFVIGMVDRGTGSAVADVLKFVRGVEGVVLLLDYLD